MTCCASPPSAIRSWKAPVADPRGFLEVQRRLGPLREPLERVGDYRDVHLRAPEGDVRQQARRCMSCGVPFCHTGCPLGNLIPDWNDLVHRGRWQEASERLHSTNSFPELTGKLCPAPCEEACVLTINDDAVTIKEIEWAIVERAWEEGWITPQPAAGRSGRSVGVVGSGPAGLAAAQQLARAGHAVTVYERDDLPGGLLRYGIPDFKLEKSLIDRRVGQLAAEGVEFACGTSIGSDRTVDELRERHDALVLATGAQRHRALTLPGAELSGVHLAMEYLVQQNRRVAGLPVTGPELSAKGLRVAILGGGDTSADCLGNVLREGCASVVEIAHGPTPPSVRSPQRTWPEWPFLLRTYPAHEEGGEREWQLETYAIEGEDGRVRRLRARRVEFPGFAETGLRKPVPVPGGEVELDVDLVFVAIGFAGVETGDPLYGQLGVELSRRDTLPVDGTFATALPGVYAAGDCVRGADLIVQAIADGREAARSVDLALQGASALASRVAV
jgi:glutamate synthase (NADPH) small chain